MQQWPLLSTMKKNPFLFSRVSLQTKPARSRLRGLLSAGGGRGEEGGAWGHGYEMNTFRLLHARHVQDTHIQICIHFFCGKTGLVLLVWLRNPNPNPFFAIFAITSEKAYREDYIQLVPCSFLQLTNYHISADVLWCNAFPNQTFRGANSITNYTYSIIVGPE